MIQYLYKLIAILIRKNGYKVDSLSYILGRIVYKIFGLIPVEYGCIKICVTPYQTLDIFILLGDNINPFATSAIVNLLKNDGIFLDVGANHGVLSVIAAGKNSGIDVFAFEPSPRELPRIYKNILLNSLSNITVIPYGLANFYGKQKLVLTDDQNPGMNSLPSIRSEGDLIECTFMQLQQFMNDELLSRIKVCKVDIEGQEMNFLASIRSKMHFLNQCYFVIEITPSLLSMGKFSVDHVYEFFEQFGFIPQYGLKSDQEAWEECFYHPEFSSPVPFSAKLP
jgi:FkbM family methyltransferase